MGAAQPWLARLLDLLRGLGDLAGSPIARSAGLLAAGEQPVAPEANHPLPFPVVDTASARRLAVRLETDAAATWRYLIAVSAPGEGGAC